jgi:lysozyme
MAYVPGIDVSSWEPNIDWRQVRLAGYRFAFLKATEGVAHVDSTFAQNWVNTKRVGILRGAYHYLRGDMDGKLQADLYLQTIGIEAGDFPPVLDVENINNENVPNSKMIAQAEIWLQRVEEITHRKPIIYSGPYFLKDRMSRPVFGPPSWAMQYPLWIANYPYTYHEGSLPIQPVGWQNWKVWQYTDKGIVPGIDGQVDLNWFRGTIEELYAFAGATEVAQAEHAVMANETLITIAAQYGLTLIQLVEANPQIVQPGMTLKIPQAVIESATTNVELTPPVVPPVVSTPVIPSSSSKPGYVMYTIRAGDNLTAIAARYNTSVDKIAAANGISNPNQIDVGQQLKIPTD